MGRHPDCELPDDQCQVNPAGALWPSVLEQFSCVTCGRNWQQQRVAGVHHEVVVVSMDPPVNVDVPYAALDGETITCTMGNWTNEPIAYLYEWLRDGTSIAPGTGANTYDVTSVDAGTTITCVVTASNQYGDTTAPPSNDVVVAAARREAAGAASKNNKSTK